ncbi:MAG: hypothetical protein H6660_07145 [Ardenticatenaceae bacterium]|nr:hypothetical protein [Ardenticatenaceae bacterium]
MKQQRLIERHHPLFSPVALVSTLLLLILLGIALWQTGGRAFSPGKLSAVSVSQQQSGGFPDHAAFADDCTQCHTAFTGIEAAGCESCHTTIATQRQEQSGLHGRINATDCAACHKEHRGPEYDLFHAAFDHFSNEHHAALFLLDGAHVDLQCLDCHENDRFIGTDSTCAACHAEPTLHQGLFGTDCAACHTSAGWRPARLARHTFPLDHGGEGEIACATCHTDNLTAYSCDACHAPAEMADEHDELNITPAELNACTACHPTGLEEEAEDRNS